MELNEIIELIKSLREEQKEGVTRPKEYNSKLNIILDELKNNLEL